MLGCLKEGEEFKIFKGYDPFLTLYFKDPDKKSSTRKLVEYPK